MQVEASNGHGGGSMGDPARTTGQSNYPNLRNLLRQNSEKAGTLAENVVLPMNKRSLKRGEAVIAFDLEGQPLPVPFDKSQIQKEFPIFMISISIIQALLFYYGGEDAMLILGYDPYRRHEIWRYLTIMLVHSSASHLWGNLVFQLILGVLLEIVHHWKRIGIIYLCGVLGGSLAITVFSPDSYGVGASAGVYALLTAHLATIILNWNEMDRKCCRVFWLLAYICFDVGLNIWVELHLQKETNTSHAGHFGGALTGFLVAVYVLKNFEKHPWEKTFQKICAVVIGLLIFTILIINISFPSYYLKSELNMEYHKTYVIHVFDTIDKSAPDSSIRIACFTSPECKEVYDQYKNGTLDFDAE